jgi:hypothetical protein
MLSRITAILHGIACYLVFFTTFLDTFGFLSPTWKHVFDVVLSEQTRCKCLTGEADGARPAHYTVRPQLQNERD